MRCKRLTGTTSTRMFIILVALTTTAARCNPSWADDAGKALKTTPERAIDIVQSGAAKSAIPEERFAQIAIQHGDEVLETRPALLIYLDDMQVRLGESDGFWRDVFFGIYCDASVRVRSGETITEEDVYNSALSSWGVEVAEELLRVGWIGDVLSLIAAARADDAGEMRLILAEAIYCSGRA